jgi:hypothetical protein
MEYGPENNIFILKMMIKSGLEKNILKFLHKKAQSYKFSNKNGLFCAWRDFNKNLCGISTYHK